MDQYENLSPYTVKANAKNNSSIPNNRKVKGFNEPSDGYYRLEDVGSLDQTDQQRKNAVAKKMTDEDLCKEELGEATRALMSAARNVSHCKSKMVKCGWRSDMVDKIRLGSSSMEAAKSLGIIVKGQQLIRGQNEPSLKLVNLSTQAYYGRFSGSKTDYKFIAPLGGSFTFSTTKETLKNKDHLCLELHNSLNIYVPILEAIDVFAWTTENGLSICCKVDGYAVLPEDGTIFKYMSNWMEPQTPLTLPAGCRIDLACHTSIRKGCIFAKILAIETFDKFILPIVKGKNYGSI